MRFIRSKYLSTVGFPDGASGEEPTCQRRRHRDMGSIRGLERYPGGVHGNPFQYSTHSRIPWTEGPGELQSTRSQRVGQY